MDYLWLRRWLSCGLMLVMAGLGAAAQAGSVKGTFVMNGVEAGLTHGRAVPFELDEGGKKQSGYAVLLSAKPTTGDIHSWDIAQPSERGSFVYLLLESDGDVWSAKLGHTARSGGAIGVIVEVVKAAFEVKGRRLVGHYRTMREQTFFDVRYTVDLMFDVPLEGK